MVRFATWATCAGFAALVGAGTIVHAQGEVGTYSRVDEVMDWGAVTTKLIVNLGVEVSEGSVDTESFRVNVSRSDPRLEEPLLEEGNLELTSAYISDAEGNAVDVGSYATLVPLVGPTVSLSSALNYGADPVAGGDLNAWTENVYTITQQQPIGAVEGIVATEMTNYTRPGIDSFEFSSSTYQDEAYGPIDLTYASFTPAADEGANPLIVWLHGGGEGGTDPTIPLAANRADTFASAEVQQHFGGAYVLVPQSPTRWMHGPAGQQGSNEKQDAQSIYTRAVQDLVETFVGEQPDIDINRIYLGGLSNGGWMTVRLLLDYPSFYAAALPIAEPINLDYVTENELERIVDIPIWIITAATDTTVPPEEFPVPLYNSLQNLGADDVHLSYLPRVIDTTGNYTSADGSPYEYPGHWSWIPVYNNHLAFIDGEAGQLYGPIAEEVSSIARSEVVTVMEWLAAQSK